MPETDIVDKQFDKNKTEQYHISIQVDLDGVSFCILDPALEKYLVLRKYDLNNERDPESVVDRIENIFNDDELLNDPFASASLIYVTQKSTLVPSSFFEETKLKNYFEFNQALDELDELNFNFLPDIDSYNVFAIPTYVANQVYNKFRNVKFYHQSTPFIKSAINGLSDETAVLLNLNCEFFDVIVKEKSALKFYNTFKFMNETDLLYFVMYVVKQLNIDTKSVLFTLCGEKSNNQDYFNALSKYLPNLSYFEPVYPGFGSGFDKIELHKFFNLFYLYNCG
jgi:hypothetical protein